MVVRWVLEDVIEKTPIRKLLTINLGGAKGNEKAGERNGKDSNS